MEKFAYTGCLVIPHYANTKYCNRFASPSSARAVMRRLNNHSVVPSPSTLSVLATAAESRTQEAEFCSLRSLQGLLSYIDGTIFSMMWSVRCISMACSLLSWLALYCPVLQHASLQQFSYTGTVPVLWLGRHLVCRPAEPLSGMIEFRHFDRHPMIVT